MLIQPSLNCGLTGSLLAISNDLIIIFGSAKETLFVEQIGSSSFSKIQRADFVLPIAVNNLYSLVACGNSIFSYTHNTTCVLSNSTSVSIYVGTDNKNNFAPSSYVGLVS